MSPRVYQIISVCLFALAVQASSPSDAELQRLTANLESAKTQADMNLASRRLSGFWDARLTDIEDKVEGKLGSRERKRFVDSKRRWRSYRSKEVAFRAGFIDGGSIQPLIANGAYSQITEHRVSELGSLFMEALDGAEPHGAANWSQPIRSGTNRTSGAAGSRR